MYAGIEAGGTKWVCAVGTGPDDLTAETTFPTTTPQETLGRMADFLREHEARLDAVGIASFGPVDLDASSPTYGSITSTPKSGWNGADVVGAARDAVDMPIGFDTDVNGAALGEGRWGAAKGLDTFVYVTVGTGIGGGGVVRGELLHGLLHPEMGHLLVRHAEGDDFAGVCPYHGDCLEGMAAGPALKQRWGRPAEELEDDLEAALELQASYLGQLATALTLTLSPQLIILGGGVMKLPGLVERVRDETVALLGGYIDVPAVTKETDSYIVIPGLGDRAGVLGAIALAERAA